MIRGLFLFLFVLMTYVCAAQNIQVAKLSPSLLEKNRHLSSDSAEISVVLKNDSIAPGFRLRPAYRAAGIFTAKLSLQEILALAGRSDVLFINERHPPKEELSTGAVDYTLNRITKAHHFFPLIKGDSIFLSVKERAYDTTDIDIKGRHFSSGVEAPFITVHAAVMATIVVGAGNTSPFAAGVAPSAFVSSASFANLFPEPDSFYVKKNISVQNHSYGTVVENFYGAEAVAYDVAAINLPKLVQVFSAGNSGSATPISGVYANIAAMANLTGNFKQSKNTISVAALDSAGMPMTAASRGPAYDGRLKPELAAYGEDGSSGAAALVSGTAALMQDAYKKATGSLPSSYLIKAILVNSADDVGATGIDYLTGYGSLNAYNALQTINLNRFFQNSVTQNDVKTFPLTVPANTAQVKITVAWNDAAAQPNAAKALVNDIDVVLKNIATGETWLPWVLNPTAVKDSLLQAPQRKKDTLNNVEQISIDAPPAGDYAIEIRGTKVTTAAQAFAVAYSMDTASRFSWDYPTGSDALLAGTAQMLRWSTTFSASSSLQYSYNGINWLPVSAVNLAANSYKWAVPDTTANVLLRMSIGAHEFLSDTVSVSPQLSLQVGFNCADSFQLFWKKLPVARYTLYRLGNKYLEPFITTADTSIVFNKAQNPSLYYGVAPVTTKPALRSNTISYPGGGVGCYILSFYLQSQTGNNASFLATLGTLYSVKELSLQKLVGGNYISVQTAGSVTALLTIFTDASLVKGENRYRLKLTLQNGQTVYSDVETVFYFADSPVYVYPNPVKRGEAIKIISSQSGRYTVRFLNATGTEVYRQFITSNLTILPSSRFASGLYFIWIFDKEGSPFVQKLIVQ